MWFARNNKYDGKSRRSRKHTQKQNSSPCREF